MPRQRQTERLPCKTKQHYSILCGLGGIRTPNLGIRSPTLYPVELRALSLFVDLLIRNNEKSRERVP